MLENSLTVLANKLYCHHFVQYYPAQLSRVTPYPMSSTTPYIYIVPALLGTLPLHSTRTAQGRGSRGQLFWPRQFYC